MIRLIAATTLLAATLASHGAIAQSTYAHHTFCLKSGASQDCAYDSMAQCQKAKKGNSDSCVQNGPAMNH